MDYRIRVKFNEFETSKGKSLLVGRTLKERILHLLALRPCGKQELLARIDSDGVNDEDKSLLSFKITKILESVSQTNIESFPQTYILKPAFWKDVSENWPFYTEEEQKSFRQRRVQNSTP